MTTIEIKNIGPIKEAKFELNKVNAFMGPQSSGKSTIAKIISFCTWVEKDVATSQSLSKYQENKTFFKQQLEEFHKMKDYFKVNSYIHYRSEVVNILWENDECSVNWVDRYAYKRSKIAYIPSERNMVILPEARKAEFGDTNIRSFLFDWFEARKKYSLKNENENLLSILNLGINYYYIEGNQEDRIMGVDKDSYYDIPLSSASSGLQSITPLIAMIEYLIKWIYNENKTSFEQDERKYKVQETLIENKILKPYYNRENLQQKELTELLNSFLEKLRINDNKAINYVKEFKKLFDQLFITQNSQFIIEEPEQNLFPETQRDLIYYMLCVLNKSKRDHRLTFTTHSPYILYALNNCLMGYNIKDRVEDKSEFRSSASWIDPEKVSIWQIGNGKLFSVKDKITKTVTEHYFNEITKDIMDEYYDMLHFYEYD